MPQKSIAGKNIDPRLVDSRNLWSISLPLSVNQISGFW